MKPFTARERRLIAALRTPRAVQRWLTALPYNWERRGETQRAFRQVVRHGAAHCLEAALSAATILEQHGHPPLLVSFQSQDRLDHVIYVFRERGKWGAVARSRDPGLTGRRPLFATVKALARSYMDTYVDETGRVVGFGLADLRDLGGYDWRLSLDNRWKVEQWLIYHPHQKIGMSNSRYHALRRRYLAYKQAHGGRKPEYYANRRTWMK